MTKEYGQCACSELEMAQQEIVELQQENKTLSNLAAILEAENEKLKAKAETIWDAARESMGRHVKYNFITDWLKARGGK